jgi:mono/diheme cytochrome c family protein
MKKAIIILSVISGFIFSCTSEKTQKLFNSDNIRTQLFSINPQKENRIKGVRGGEFKIPAGAFEGTEPVIIELKEIYAPIEILASGLTTESNGELLESGGMFYINAKRNGEALELLKPIDGSIPTEYINDSMKLFKGEVMADGNVNWVEPEDLKNDTSKNEECIKAGQILFWQNCASCHAVTKQLTGPALAGADKRLTREMYYELVHNPAEFARKNEYFKCQIHSYNGVLMTNFPQLGNDAIDCIIKFINNEVKKRPDLKGDIDTTFRGNEACDASQSLNFPCGVDTFYVDTVPRVIDFNLPPLHLEAPKEDSADYLYSEPGEMEDYMRKNGFTDLVETTETDRYNFTIKTLGWYNVDAYFKGLEGTSIVNLKADTDFANEQKLEVTVFMPARKLLTVGTYHREDGLFHFEKYKGDIPLYLNDKAVALAITSINDKIYYGIVSFKVKNQETIFIKVKETTKENLFEAIRKMNLNGIDLDVITKKQIIKPNPCNGSDSSSNK